MKHSWPALGFSTKPGRYQGRGRDDPDAYDRIYWHRRDTLDPELRRRRIPLSLLIALCIRAGRPIQRAA